MVGSLTDNDLGAMYRQRARWFLLLGALLGGIILIAAAVGFSLETWGNHLGGGSGENAHGIAIALAIVLTVMVIVIGLLIWRVRVLMSTAERFETRVEPAGAPGTSPVNEAVAAWTSSVLSAHTHNDVPERHNPGTGRMPQIIDSPSQAAGALKQRNDSAKMAIELTISPLSSNQTLADVMQSVMRGDIEPDSLWTTTDAHGDHVHLVVRDAEGIEARLAASNVRVNDRQDVVLIELVERPGGAADVLHRLEEAGATVKSAHLASSTRMIVVSDDPARVIEVLR